MPGAHWLFAHQPRGCQSADHLGSRAAADAVGRLPLPGMAVPYGTSVGCAAVIGRLGCGVQAAPRWTTQARLAMGVRAGGTVGLSLVRPVTIGFDLRFKSAGEHPL